MQSLETLPAPWTVAGARDIVAPPCKSLANVLSLTKRVGKGIRTARVIYTLRGKPAYTDEDVAARDDSVLLEFTPQLVDVSQLADAVLPTLVSSFRAYRARISVPEIVSEEFELRQALSRASTKDIGGRDSVFRIWQLNYWDEELCRRAWNLTAAEVVERLHRRIERAALWCGGAYLIISTARLSVAEVRAIDGRIRPFLTAEPRVPPALSSRSL